MLFHQKDTFSQLVREISRTIGESVIFTNEQGVIIASTEVNRIGSFHEGAKVAMKNRKYMHMTEDCVNRFEGVRKGVVTPIFIDERPVGVVGITGEPTRIEPFILIVQRMAELFIKNVVDQIAQERSMRNLELFVFDWLNKSLSLSELYEYAEFYQLDLSHYEQVILLQTEHSKSLDSENVKRFIRLWDEKEDALFVRWGQGKFLLLDCYRPKEQLQIKLGQFLEVNHPFLGSNVYIGVGQKSDYSQLEDSLNQAQMALKLANKKRPIVYEEELVFEYIQHQLDGENKEVFIRRTLEPLLSEDELLKTLDVWLMNRMKVDQTVRELHIHKNTLYYRLNKIEELTKKDMNQMHDIVLLYMALKFIEK